MSIEELLKVGSINRFKATQEEISRAIEIARRDLVFAESIFKQNLDWSYVVAYNAVLQAGRAYMFSLGYRPAATGGHKAVFEFLQLNVDESLNESISYFDRVRRKRHRTVYDEVGLITEKEVKNLLKRVREFISYVESSLRVS